MENKTAVQLLLDKFQEAHKDFGGLDTYWLHLFAQALELEKQQIIDARIGTDNECQKMAAEKYYSETYKSQKE